MSAPAGPTWGGTLRISHAADDPRWDDFVTCVDGHHTQTALWGRVKAQAGWQVRRVIAERDGCIEGGAQVLSRSVQPLVRAGYVSMGPVLAPGSAAGPSVLAALGRLAASEHMRLVSIQPPDDLVSCEDRRTAAGLGSIGLVVPRATAIVDVSRPPDEMLKAMNSRTRYNARLGAKRGIIVRAGDRHDLQTFQRLLVATAQRQRFTPYTAAYYRQVWDTLAPGGHVRLTLAEVDEEAVSAQLVVAFGKTVVNKMSVWSGLEGSRRPNEALQWDTMQWAHSQGYRHYDLEGISVAAAEALLGGEALPARFNESVTSYKLGFGGAVVLRPEPAIMFPNRAALFAYRHLSPHLQHSRRLKRFVKRVRITPAQAGR